MLFGAASAAVALTLPTALLEAGNCIGAGSLRNAKRGSGLGRDAKAPRWANGFASEQTPETAGRVERQGKNGERGSRPERACGPRRGKTSEGAEPCECKSDEIGRQRRARSKPSGGSNPEGGKAVRWVSALSLSGQPVSAKRTRVK